MMPSRTGWDRCPLSVAGQTDEGRRAPWGCAAGAPYRGTASPPPPCMCCLTQRSSSPTVLSFPSDRGFREALSDLCGLS